MGLTKPYSNCNSSILSHSRNLARVEDSYNDIIRLIASTTYSTSKEGRPNPPNKADTDIITIKKFLLTLIFSNSIRYRG